MAQISDRDKDIVRIIGQYLESEGYLDSTRILQEESGIMLIDDVYDSNVVNKMKKAIHEGDWSEVERLCFVHNFKHHKSFLYCVYKQCYLELIEKQEYQKAFTYLTRRLKPLESLESNPQEFSDLCYLLTCKSVHDAPSFKHWMDGTKSIERQKLEEKFQEIIQLRDQSPHKIKRNRLKELLYQAIAYQLKQTNQGNNVAQNITTLLRDFKPVVPPNVSKHTFVGHKENVKCVEFVRTKDQLVSGSSDNTLKLWSTETGNCLDTLHGHKSRVWDVASNENGKFITSASGDATVKLWQLEDKGVCVQTFLGHKGDVYTVRFHPGQDHIVTGGYDKTVRLFDVRTGALKKTFVGHHSSVSRAIFNPSGNLIISGSKDSTIKFWDIASGLCIQTISAHLGEVTSIEINSSGTLLLSGSKDNCNRLWEMSTLREMKVFNGHQNTSKNFIRCGFGPNENFVIGGSEDGLAYVWDIGTGQILQKLKGHTGMVYNAVWSEEKSLLASCSHDNCIRTWVCDVNKREGSSHV